MNRLTWVLLLSIFSFSSFAETFNLVADKWLPYTGRNLKDGGLATKIIQAALASQGHQAKVQILPWTRVLSYLRSGRIDGIIAIWHSKERERFIRFSDHYLTNDLVFISHVKKPFEYNQFSDLKRKKIGVIHKYAYDEKFNSSKIYSKDVGFSLSSNLEKLFRGRIDITLDDYYVLKHALKKNKVLSESIYFSKTPLRQTKLYFGTKKGTQKGDKLIKIFNKGLKEIKANGTYQQILKSYLK